MLYERRYAMNRKWTDEMDGELRRLYTTTTAPELARRFGVTPGTLRQHALRIGLRKKQPGKIILTEQQRFWMRRRDVWRLEGLNMKLQSI